MTEDEWARHNQDWDESSDCMQMLAYLIGKVGDRKFRHFACECCRLIWDELTEYQRRVIEIAERYADGLATEREVIQVTLPIRTARQKLFTAIRDNHPPARLLAPAAIVAGACILDPDPYEPELTAGWRAACAVSLDVDWACSPLEKAAHPRLVRDIFGNPFRPVAVDPSWLTSSVLALAEGIYADRAFDRIPVLGDALEDAGCGNEDILNHCRGDGPHVRGCWVVDLILGKS